MDLWNALIVPPRHRPRERRTNQVGQLPSVSNPSFWDGKAPGVPDLSRRPNPRPSAVHQQADTQYPALEASDAPQDLRRRFRISPARKIFLRKPHPLSHAVTSDSLPDESEPSVSEDTTRRAGVGPENAREEAPAAAAATVGAEAGLEKGGGAVADPEEGTCAAPVNGEIGSRSDEKSVGAGAEDTKDTPASNKGGGGLVLEKGASSLGYSPTSAASPAVEVQSRGADITLNMESTNKSPKRKLSYTTDGSNFERADKKIRYLAQRVLPNIPHLVSVPTKHPYLPTFPFENLRTPFEDWEVKHLQHMTLLSHNGRGVAWVRGDWEDEINAFSPHNSGPRSGTATPRSERDPNRPRIKMSLADYKAGKRPATSSQPAAVNPTQRAQNSSNLPAPAVSPTQEMIDQIVQNHAVSARNTNAERGSAPPWRADPRHAAPPQQQQPKVPNLRDAKRMAEPLDSARPEKRLALEPNIPPKSSQRDGPTPKPKPILDLTPPSSNLQKLGVANEKTTSIKQRENTIPGKENEKPVNGSKKEKMKLEDGPIREQQKQNTSPERKQKTVTSSKNNKETAANNKRESKEAIPGKEKEKPSDESRDVTNVNRVDESMDVLPPLLSPLPPPYDKPQTNFDDVVETGAATEKSVAATPRSSTDDMPPLLSPIPKEFFDKLTREAELAIARHQEEEKKKLDGQKRQAETEAPNPTAVEHSKNTNTVESRRERSRQSDAPGVARKTVKPSTSKSRKLKKSDDVPDGPEGAEQSLIVKLKYKKRNARNIERLLNTKPHPANESQSLPRPVDKKRAHPSDDAEPSAKRKKALPAVEASKAPSPRNFRKSPVPSTSPLSQKGPLGTPRKSEAAKSIAMRKIDSSDGRARTPQGPSPSVPSAPASTEKSRASVNASESEAQKASFDSYLSLGKTIKRQADSLLRTKEKEANRGIISEEDKRLGTVVTIESVIAFMLGFNAFDRHRQIERKLTVAEHWSGLIPLLSFATEKARPYAQLYTLTLLLNVVSRESLDRIYTEHLSAETPSKEPGYLKLREDLIQNSKARRHVLQQYIEQKKVAPVDFALSASDAKAVAMSILGQFCTENQVDWSPKI